MDRLKVTALYGQMLGFMRAMVDARNISDAGRAIQALRYIREQALVVENQILEHMIEAAREEELIEEGLKPFDKLFFDKLREKVKTNVVSSPQTDEQRGYRAMNETQESVS
jgi:hypothetical protein